LFGIQHPDYFQGGMHYVGFASLAGKPYPMPAPGFTITGLTQKNGSRSGQ